MSQLIELDVIEITVNASASEAFSVLTNLKNFAKWSSQTKLVTPLTDGDMRQGFEFEAGDGKRKYRYIVSQYTPGQIFQFQEIKGVGFRGTLEFEQVAAGQTRVTFIQEAHNGMLMKLSKPLVMRMMRKMNRRDSELMQALFEG